MVMATANTQRAQRKPPRPRYNNQLAGFSEEIYMSAVVAYLGMILGFTAITLGLYFGFRSANLI